MQRIGKCVGLISGVLLLAPFSLAQVPTRRPDMRAWRQPAAQRALSQQAIAPPTAATTTTAAAPLAQVPMDQTPSTPPQVSYQGGMLTIVSHNSTLGDILHDVQKLTGATIDVPGNATERVATRLGPGPARDILASLLNGCAYNYVMVGSASDPNSLASVILTSKPAGGEAMAANYQPPPQYQMIQPAVPAPGTGPGGPVAHQATSDDDEDADDKDDEDAEDQSPNSQPAQAEAAAEDGSQPSGGPKSPQEILEMLRQKHPELPGPMPGQPIPHPNPQQPPQDPNQ